MLFSKIIFRMQSSFLKNPQGFGVLIALVGVLILTPDTMLMRLSSLSSWPLMAWRGLLMGPSLFIIWLIFFYSRRELKNLITFQGICVILLCSLNSVTFTLGVQETSVTVVLTAVATIPMFSAIFSKVLMREQQGIMAWVSILLTMIGVAVVVGDGGNAIGKPSGSVLLGAFYGLVTAICLAAVFTLARKYRDLGLVPAIAIGAFFSGVLGLSLSEVDDLFLAPLWTVFSMGFFILPLSFLLLSLAPRYTTSAIVSLLMLLEMVFGPFWVWLGVGEKPSITMIMGACFVFFMITFHLLFLQRTVQVES